MTEVWDARSSVLPDPSLSTKLGTKKRMARDPISTPPAFSIIICVYNDWSLLDDCLRSLAGQASAPSLEVIIVDDGSRDDVPDSIQQWIRNAPVTIVKQPHAGIATARNRGIQAAKGSVLVFVDADCKLQANCLAVLSSAIADFPQTDYFQLRITGDCANLVGRAEELRLISFQNHMLQPDGRIRYLNTAGFAIRRSKADVEAGLFDVRAIRAEDTLLLAMLMQRGELPRFVVGATVQHAIHLSLMECFLKDIRSAYVEGPTYDIVSALGVKIRVSQRERLQVLCSMWKTAGQNSIGRTAWFVLLARQTLQRIVSFGYRYLRIRPTKLRKNA